jgi:hypothetical protein
MALFRSFFSLSEIGLLMLERIEFDQTLYAIILRADFRGAGIQFFTPSEFSQQLAYMSRPQGHQVQPHFHRKIERQVFLTQEVLFMKSGRVRVDYYDNAEQKVGSSTLSTGDVILLSEGGHGFEFLQDSEMIEVKQGPYLGDHDKIRFSPQK